MNERTKELIDDFHHGVKIFPETYNKIKIPVIILCASWLILDLLTLAGVNELFLIPLKFFSAGSRTNGGLISFFGGIAAKLALVIMLTDVVFPFIKNLFTSKKTEKGNKISFKELTKWVFMNGLKPIGYFTTGFGIAFFLYAFLSMDGSLQNSFVIILALFASNRAIFLGASKILKLIFKLLNIDALNADMFYAMMLGLSFGFALSTAFAALFHSAYLGYLVSLFFILSGIIILFIERKKERN